MNNEKRIAIYSTLRDRMPAPTTELNYRNPFELLIAVILSAQATDIGVNKATDKLYPVACTPEDIHALGVEGLKPYIKTIGLFNSKAKNIIETCRLLSEKHNREVPRTRAELEALRASGEIAGIGAGINDQRMMGWFLDRFDLDFFLVAMPYTLLDQAALLLLLATP